MRRAGAKLIEIGTTNRTHAKDYAEAITEKTALLMKVHTSNYAVVGFTKVVEEAEIAAGVRKQELFLDDDGNLVEPPAHLARWREDAT